MLHLKQSTSVDVPIGPFLDDTDGKTAETALTLTQPDIRLKKNGGAWAQKAAAQTLTHEEAGWYEVTLDATDTNTLGLLKVAVHEAGALPVWQDFMVMPANVWDSLYGASLLAVNADQISGDATAASNLEADYDGSGYGVAIQSGTSSTVVLDTGASAIDDYYNNQLITIVNGTGAGQSRLIADYTGATKTATISPNWITTPTVGAMFVLSPFSGQLSNIRKNQALTAFTFLMTDSTTHAPVTGKTVTATRSIDGGAFAAGTLSAVTELSNGLYKVNFGAADLNGNVVVLRATAAASDDTFERIITAP
jgi:hypothetical protein